MILRLFHVTTRDVLPVLLLLSPSPLAAQTTPAPAVAPADPKAAAPYPYPVGAKGNVFHINLEMNF